MDQLTTAASEKGYHIALWTTTDFRFKNYQYQKLLILTVLLKKKGSSWNSIA